MKIIITGASGQLGKEVQKQLLAKNIFFIGLSSFNLDITDFKKVKVLLSKEKPDIVINCAAYTAVDSCENNKKIAFNVNAVGPKNLAIITNNIGAKIVHISTDYVFDGLCNTSYKEYDKTNPQTVYGKSKLLGEMFVKKFNTKHFIIRTAWLYGNGNNFIKTILKKALKEKELNIVGDQIGTPTSTVDVTKIIFNLIKTKYYGLYHGTCSGKCSWYELAKKVFKFKNINTKLNKITTKELNIVTPRPKQTVLDNFMLRSFNLDTARYWEDALKAYLVD